MIYMDLFIGFLKVGFFAFGGAYAAIPLIREVVLSYGWITDDTLTYMIAVSETTPGPIMVNLATYVGSSQAGFLGAFIATSAVVLPAFLIILMIMGIFNRLLENPWFDAALKGIKPCVVGIILAVGAYMTMEVLMDSEAESLFDIKSLVLTAVIAAAAFLPQCFGKKKISPIMLIVISAALGILFF